MAKLKSGNEPTKELPVDLRENLVRLTLKMNPSLAPDMDAKEFIEHQTGKFKAITPEDLAEDSKSEEKASTAVRTIGAFFKGERGKLAKTIGDIKRQREVLDREAGSARRKSITLLVNHLAVHLSDIEDLKQVLAQNKVFLQELAISEKDFVKEVTDLRRKLRGS